MTFRIEESSARIATFALAFLVSLAAGCNDRSPEPPPATTPAIETPPVAPPRADSSGPRRRIVALGDSLTAGYGLPKSESYPEQLQRMLDERGYAYEVVASAVSGETSAGGARRVDRALEGDVDILIVALGGNDALRGLPPRELAKNLDAIVAKAKKRGAKVLLAGMEAPPYLGAEYTTDFHNVYAEIAKDEEVTLLPFLLEGVAGGAPLKHEDGIDPQSEGAKKVAENVLGALGPLLER
jgi:acyl-CoA thioesterase-1